MEYTINKKLNTVEIINNSTTLPIDYTITYLDSCHYLQDSVVSSSGTIAAATNINNPTIKQIDFIQDGKYIIVLNDGIETITINIYREFELVKNITEEMINYICI